MYICYPKLRRTFTKQTYFDIPKTRILFFKLFKESNINYLLVILATTFIRLMQLLCLVSFKNNHSLTCNSFLKCIRQVGIF